jgi:hypothetical protein
MNKKRLFIFLLVVVALAAAFSWLNFNNPSTIKKESAVVVIPQVTQHYVANYFDLSFDYYNNKIKVEENETLISLTDKESGELLLSISGNDTCDTSIYANLEKSNLNGNVFWKFSKPFSLAPGYSIVHPKTGVCLVISMPGSIPEKTYAASDLKLLEDVTTSMVFTEKAQVKDTSTSLANPASVNCVKQGGTLEIQTKEDGSQYGLCYFDDARACEEWAMMRGDCPVGGVKTTGFDTVAQKYCAWLGGQTLAVPDAICNFNDNSACLDADLYLDACKKGDWPKEK